MKGKYTHIYKMTYIYIKASGTNSIENLKCLISIWHLHFRLLFFFSHRNFVDKRFGFIFESKENKKKRRKWIHKYTVTFCDIFYIFFFSLLNKKKKLSSLVLVVGSFNEIKLMNNSWRLKGKRNAFMILDLRMYYFTWYLFNWLFFKWM